MNRRLLCVLSPLALAGCLREVHTNGSADAGAATDADANIGRGEAGAGDAGSNTADGGRGTAGASSTIQSGEAGTDAGLVSEEPEACVNDPNLRPPAAATPVLGAGNALVPSSNEWIDRASNGAGIQGGFYHDYSSTAPPAGSICASGYLDGLTPGSYYTALGFYLNQEPQCFGTRGALPYNAAAHGVTGFGFGIVSNVGTPLRFAVKAYQGLNTYCIDIPACAMGCSVDIGFDELRLNCEPGARVPDATFLEVLEWQLTGTAANAMSSAEYQFCVQGLVVRTASNLDDAGSAAPSP